MSEMDVEEALALLWLAVVRCQEAGLGIGVRPVRWAGRVEIVLPGVQLVDGEFRVVDCERAGMKPAPTKGA